MNLKNIDPKHWGTRNHELAGRILGAPSFVFGIGLLLAAVVSLTLINPTTLFAQSKDDSTATVVQLAKSESSPTSPLVVAPTSNQSHTYADAASEHGSTERDAVRIHPTQPALVAVSAKTQGTTVFLDIWEQ